MQQEEEIIIDGSAYEGGGQILRSALALSVIFQKRFKIINIRANRPNPGINNQLLSQINLIANLIKCEMIGNQLSSTEFTFIPLNRYQPQNLICQAKTAQSITLILQSLIPISLNKNQEITIHVFGGTYLNHSPSIQSWKNIFLQQIKEMGIQCDIEIIKEGYYPQGGGEVKAKLYPVQQLKPIVKIEVAKINRLQCTYLLGKNQYIEQYNNKIINCLQQFSDENKLQIESNIKLVNSKKFKECYGIVLESHSELNSYDHSIINSEDSQIQTTIENILKESQKFFQNQTCFDEFHQDQYILFMALAKGESSILIGEPSPHSLALIQVIKQFLPQCKFDIEKVKENQYILKIQGINIEFQ